MSGRWWEAGGAAINAVLGDYLAARDSALATPMELYDHGRPLVALPRGQRRLSVLVHGMGCTEECWSFPESPELDYGRLLERSRGFTPLYVRYNTGLPIVQNGKDFAVLMAAIVELSPVPVEELLLIGHSLGGLVIRSACHFGRRERWTNLVRRVFYVGSPHLGSPVAKAGHVAATVLQSIDEPVVRALGEVSEIRSAAVRDLRDGDIVDDQETVPPDPRFEHFSVAGSLPNALAALVLGDGLVRADSAFAPADHVGEFRGLHHMALAHHVDVYDWIAARCGAEAPTEPVEPNVGEARAAPPVGAYAELLGDAVDKGSSTVQSAHEAIAARPYDVLDSIPPLRGPTRVVRAVHFGVLRGTYDALRRANALVGSALGSATDDETPPPKDNSRTPSK